MEKSDEGAVQWYRQAADQKHAAAQFCLGFAYEYGQGVQQSYEGAVQWYRQAADQNHATAQFCLGFAYEKGRGVQQSYEGAVLWYRQAADQGHADAAKFCLEVEAAIAAAEAEASDNK